MKEHDHRIRHLEQLVANQQDQITQLEQRFNDLLSTMSKRSLASRVDALEKAISTK